MSRVLELKEEAGRLVNEARSILAKAESEKREMTDEESVRFDALHNDADKKLAEAQRHERQALADDGFKSGKQEGARQSDGDEQPAQNRRQRPVSALATPEYHSAFMDYLQFGRVSNALQVDVDSSGGFIAVSERLLEGILKNVDNAVIVRQLANVLSCGLNETLGQVTLASDVSGFEWGGGETEDADEDDGPTFGKRELRPRRLKRKVIKISKELIRSARIDVEAFVQARTAYQLAITLEQAYMTGDGSNQPLGLFTASADGVPTTQDVNSGDNTGLTPDGLIDTQAALKDAYQGAARWLLHRDFIKRVRKLKDGDGVYIWQPGLQTGQPNLLLGKPYITSEYAPNTWTQNSYVALYGDFSHYYIADATTMTVQRLVETYAKTGQIGLLFDQMGADGMPALAEAFVRVKLSA